MHQFITSILYVVQPVRRGRSVRKARTGQGGGVRTAVGGTNVSFCSELAIGVVLNDGAGGGGDMNGSYGMDG